MILGATTTDLGALTIVVDLMFYVAFLLYVLFALLVVVQVRRMLSAIQAQFDHGIRLIAGLHVLVAVAALLLAFMVL